MYNIIWLKSCVGCAYYVYHVLVCCPHIYNLFVTGESHTINQVFFLSTLKKWVNSHQTKGKFKIQSTPVTLYYLFPPVSIL